jgi:hypothetical protein
MKSKRRNVDTGDVLLDHIKEREDTTQTSNMPWCDTLYTAVYMAHPISASELHDETTMLSAKYRDYW